MFNLINQKSIRNYQLFDFKFILKTKNVERLINDLQSFALAER